MSNGIRESLAGQVLRLFDMLAAREPVTVETLFAAVNNTPGIYDKRQMQQRLGGTITALNRVLVGVGLRAVPGEPRGTYRIREIAS